MAPELFGHPGVRVRIFAHRKEPVLTGKAGAARYRERNYDAIALLEILYGTANFFHDAHEFVAQDIALLHAWDKAVIEMQVGSANSGGRDSDDCIPLIQNLRVGYVLYLNVLFPHPTVSLHNGSLQK